MHCHYLGYCRCVSMALAKAKQKLWSEESMCATVQSVQDGKGLREASWLNNVPVETLRRRTTGKVELDCKPGPSTVLTKEEEDRLNTYSIQMVEMGFGLSSEDVMQMAYVIVDRSGRTHPFKNGKAGRGWFEGFRARYPQLTIRTPHSHCHTAGLSALTRKPLISLESWGLSALTRKPSMISLESWELCMAG